MAFAPSSTYFDCGDGTVVGSFVEKDCNNFFEYSENTDGTTGGWDFPHKVYVSNHPLCNDSGYRYAKVLKTVAYVAVDEDATGHPVVEKWSLKSHRVYPRPA